MSVSDGAVLAREKWVDEVVSAMQEEVGDLYNALAACGEHFERQERLVRDWFMKAGASALKRFYELGGRRGHVGTSLPCNCGPQGEQVFQGYRGRSVVTLVGSMELERAYYHCQFCGKGLVPLDERIGLNGHSFSPAVQRLTSHLGGEIVFHRVKGFLNEVGIELSTKEAERRTEETGRKIEALHQERIIQAKKGKRLEGERRDLPQRLYLQVDGTKAHMLTDWKEAKLGAIFETEVASGEAGRLRRGDTTYCAAFETAEKFGWRLFATATSRGSHLAKEVVFMGDGASWVWNLAAEHFPERVEILDWYHASEHLWDLAKVVFGEGTKECKRWVKIRLRELKKGNIEAVLEAMNQIRPHSREVREKLRKEKAYFRNNGDRMRYAEFKRKGYFIGSGVVESGCKRAVTQRLKLAGMRWKIENANAVLQVHLANLNGEFDNLWAQTRAA